VTVDAGSIVEQDVLLKLVKPLLEETDTHVIAAGVVIRIPPWKKRNILLSR
jgi:hypothetical protein